MAIVQSKSNEQLIKEEEKEALELAESEVEDISEMALTELAGHIRNVFQEFRRARNEEGLDLRIKESLSTYNGHYSNQKLNQIKEFGGSEVYSRLTTVKCRGTTAMLRDIFLGTEQPWGLESTAVPEVRDELSDQVDSVLAYEISNIISSGEPAPDQQAIHFRRIELEKEIKRNLELAIDDATMAAERKLQDILEEGGFYQALSEFLIDLPIYPFAVIKGPVVRMDNKIKWVDGKMEQSTQPRMFWERVDPINIYMTPGASYAEDADIIEKIKLSRNDLNNLMDAPGYNNEAIAMVLEDYSKGLVDWLDQTDTTYAEEQGKENPTQNVSSLIDGVQYSGYVQGKMLIDYGFTDEEIKNPELDYAVSAWLVGRHVIKVHINKNPNRLHNYYISSFEKVPGTIIGHGLPEILNDIQDTANATLRSLNNNMAIASGPQVAINNDMLAPGENDNLYPWKRWKFHTDPLMQGTQAPPINFFQPESNANELLGIYQSMSTMADEISAIPRYMTGSTSVGGAGSTASGLSMLMNNASKVLQNIAANIDRDIMMPSLQQLYTEVMLTDKTGQLSGDEHIVVQGASVAIQRETDRMRQLEFLTITANDLDMGIIGPQGRAAVLSALAKNLGLPGEQIVPNAKELEEKLMAKQAEAEQAEQAQRTVSGAPANSDRVSAGIDNASRTRSVAAINRQAGG